MLQTSLLEPFLVEKTEKQNREEIIKDCIEKISTVNQSLLDLLSYKEKSFIQKLKQMFTDSTTYGALFLMFCAILAFYGSLNAPIEKKLVTILFLYLLPVPTLLLLSNFLYFVYKNSYYDEKELIKNEEENKKAVIELFLALSDKKFEIRGELIENYSKLKIIVEENQYIDGTYSVIKNSSKSLTAYINMLESKESIIKSIVSVVKESEKKFN